MNPFEYKLKLIKIQIYLYLTWKITRNDIIPYHLLYTEKDKYFPHFTNIHKSLINTEMMKI
jgi:hypothetical protein